MSARRTLIERDPITFEVVRGALQAICEEMKSVMTQAAFSPLLSLSADLSCALLDHDGDVVAQGNDIPVHLGAMPFAARGILAAFPASTWRPGDAVVSNDPYSGGSHLPDMTLLTGIFDDAGLMGFAASRVHWPDIGGSAPGSSAVTDEIVKEGLRLPPVKILAQGEMDTGLRTVIFANVRVPGDRFGDFRAQIACNARGVQRVDTLAARYGGALLREVFANTQDLSDQRVRAALAALPDGEFRALTHLDGDGFVEDYGDGPLRLAVCVSKHGEKLTCDFTGTAPQARGPMNAPIAVTASACYYTALAIAGGDVPPNSGAYRAVCVTAPAGSLLNAAYPAPVVAGNTEMSNRVVDLLLRALAPALGDRAIGESYGCAGVWAIGGFDVERQRSFVHLETLGGGMGAHARGAGLDGHRVHMGNTMNLPIEAVEAALPVTIERYALRPGSGGAGRQSGGAGVERVIRADADGVVFSLLFERANQPAAGVAGGEPGAVANFSVQRTDGETMRVSSKTPAGILNRGDRLIMRTAGGGGYGFAPQSNVRLVDDQVMRSNCDEEES
ncbi:MAG: hydantoinase B/oxoprolinase family protein [Pseudomonadota bacterium]